MDIETKRAKQRAATQRWRERQRILGLKVKPSTEADKERRRERMRVRRAKAKARGVILPSDAWWQQNPERHRARGARWRAKNPERAREATRKNQATRRSTPWGAINNRLWAVMHPCIRRNSSRPSKYTAALGYLWSDLRAHVEAQFAADMTWDNWGEVWELDHIKPVSSFRYTSLDDPLFKEAWALQNLRPLPRPENQKKGKRE